MISRSSDSGGAIIAVAALSSLLPIAKSSADHRQDPKRKNCPVQGCILLPRDILYDKHSRAALDQLRNESKAAIETKLEASDALAELIMSGDEDMATMTLIGYKGGDPNNQVNQDRAFVISPYYLSKDDPVGTSDLDTQRLMGVFDGHAHFGERVSEHSLKQIPLVLAQRLNAHLVPGLSPQQRDEKIVKSMEEAFLQVDRTAPARPSGGCTASVILQMGPKLYIANAGDSISFIVVHRASTNVTKIVYMSREDKPELPEERERIERMGGRVLLPDGFGATSRAVYFDTSTGSPSGLAMSRSLGDWDAGEVGVIPDPIVNVVDLKKLIQQSRWSDEDDDVHIFAVSVSDGMTDFVDPQTIAKELVPALFEPNGYHPLTACERLISMAASGWQRARDGTYRDDIAISVQKIRTPPNKR